MAINKKINLLAIEFGLSGDLSNNLQFKVINLPKLMMEKGSIEDNGDFKLSGINKDNQLDGMNVKNRKLLVIIINCNQK